MSHPWHYFRHTYAPVQHPEEHWPADYDFLLGGIVSVFAAILLTSILLVPTYFKNSALLAPRLLATLLIPAVAFSIIYGIFSSEWRNDTIRTRTSFRAHGPEIIVADVGLHIGLDGFNVTLQGSPRHQGENYIDYNEHFDFGEGQGRIGFGKYGNTVARELREKIVEGVPLPVLKIAEYLSIDGEAVTWIRYYRIAGYYAAYLLWAALAAWFVATVLSLTSSAYSGLSWLITGLLMLSAVIVFAAVSEKPTIPLKIPFVDGVLEPHFGWIFYYIMSAGIVCSVVGLFFMAIREAVEHDGYMRQVFGKIGGAVPRNISLPRQNNMPGKPVPSSPTAANAETSQRH